MRRFVLVRHATAASAHPEAGLSERGRAEVEALSRRLADWRFDVGWSSDLPRAIETAESILSRHGSLHLRRSEALREVEMPRGMAPPEEDPDGYAVWERDAMASLARGLSGWLGVAMPVGMGVSHSVPPRGAGACPLPPGSSHPAILVVSHAGPLRALVCLLLGLPVAAHWSFRLDRASITVVDRGDDMGTLALLNDRCHLAGDGYGG